VFTACAHDWIHTRTTLTTYNELAANPTQNDYHYFLSVHHNTEKLIACGDV